MMTRANKDKGNNSLVQSPFSAWQVQIFKRYKSFCYPLTKGWLF